MDLGPVGGTMFATSLKVYDDRIVGISYNLNEVNVWGLSLEPGHEGELLFSTLWQAPAEWAAGTQTLYYTGATSQAEDGVIALWSKELRTHYGFSTDTGNFLWETDPEHYLNMYGYGNFEHSWWFAYDKLYSTGVSGILYCYDATTGETLWTYNAEDPYQEILWANSWWGRIPLITDGKIYLGHEEHSTIDPKPRGAPFVCLDAETGDVIWKADGLFRQTHWGGRAIIADSIIVTMDTYDQRIYAIGKGPSATTVGIQDDVIKHGDSVLIKGMVTDISTGTEDHALAKRFPNGVPAVSDADMSEWMLYVYKQFPKPADAIGVPVTLEAIDPNGNYQYLGTATTDASGNYGFAFEPEVPGQYMIMATFYGSAGYYGSTTTTYLTVDPAPEPYPTVTIPPYPGYQGPSASDVAQNVLDNLPDDPTAGDIAQEVLNQLPEYPETPEAPDYTNIFIAIIAAIAVVAVLVVYTLYTVKKQK